MVSRLRKLVWMIVAIAAMILLAPMTASAHEGHHPGLASHGSALRGPAVEPFQQGAAAQASAEAVVEAGLWAPLSVADSCVDGCCAGMACCFVAIVSVAPGLDPPVLSASPASHRAPPPLAGVRPAYHLQPPNALT